MISDFKTKITGTNLLINNMNRLLLDQLKNRVLTTVSILQNDESHELLIKNVSNNIFWN